MRKQKYRLSDEAFDRLMKKLSEIAQEEEATTSEGLQSGVITTNFVKMMTKVKGMEDVIERNEQLSKTYQGFLNLYGFDTMYDMYIYARSCDILPEELTKSENKIVMPVQKTVIRNGKPLEVTVYETIMKAAPKKKPQNVKVDKPVTPHPHARELKAVRVSPKETKDPANVAKIKAQASNLSGGNKPFNDGSSHYLYLQDGDGVVVAVMGYSSKGDYMTMDFYRTNGQVRGTAARGFAELVKLAVKNNKGVKIEDYPGARPVYVKFGLSQQGNNWVASYDELKQLFGDGMESEH